MNKNENKDKILCYVPKLRTYQYYHWQTITDWIQALWDKWFSSFCSALFTNAATQTTRPRAYKYSLVPKNCQPDRHLGDTMASLPWFNPRCDGLDSLIGQAHDRPLIPSVNFPQVRGVCPMTSTDRSPPNRVDRLNIDDSVSYFQPFVRHWLTGETSSTTGHLGHCSAWSWQRLSVYREPRRPTLSSSSGNSPDCIQQTTNVSTNITA